MIDERNKKYNIRYSSDYIVYHKGFLASKSINKIVWTIDANEYEK